MEKRSFRRMSLRGFRCGFRVRKKNFFSFFACVGLDVGSELADQSKLIAIGNGVRVS